MGQYDLIVVLNALEAMFKAKQLLKYNAQRVLSHMKMTVAGRFVPVAAGVFGSTR